MDNRPLRKTRTLLSADRRQFMIGGAAMIAGTSLKGEAMAAVGMAGRQRPYKVVYDDRFADSRDFAREAARLGVSVAAIQGDVVDLWRSDLLPLWAERSAPIAGMTSASSLFCLEQLARNHWMGVRVRIDHHVRPDGSAMAHRAMGGADFMAAADVAFDADGNWCRRLAGLLMTCPANGDRRTSADFTTARSAEPAGETLVSWLIAPNAHAGRKS